MIHSVAFETNSAIHQYVLRRE